MYRFLYISQNPLLLFFRPSYATNMILERSGLTKDDIDVYEFHEAFAGQIMAVLKALESESFCKNYMGRSEAVRKIVLFTV